MLKLQLVEISSFGQHTFREVSTGKLYRFTMEFHNLTFQPSVGDVFSMHLQLFSHTEGDMPIVERFLAFEEISNKAVANVVAKPNQLVFVQTQEGSTHCLRRIYG